VDRTRLEETLFQLLELRAREGLDYGGLLLLLSLVNLLGIVSILHRRGVTAARSERRGKAGLDELATALTGLLGATATGQAGPAALLGALGKEGKGDPLAAMLAALLGGEGKGAERQKTDGGPDKGL
jgi:hypothetical protein